MSSTRRRRTPPSQPSRPDSGVPLRVESLEARVVPALVFRNVAGVDAVSVQPTVDQFRADLGGALNPNTLGSFESGRREINWDGVPAAKSAPNALPADFFNVNSPRGVVFNTPGTGFQVSGSTADAGAGQPALEFANLNPTYPTLFDPFTTQRLFTPVGSNVMEVTFFVPGTKLPATTTGFGAVFADVDAAGPTTLQFFDAAGKSITTTAANPTPGNVNGGFTFFGAFDDTGRAGIAKVVITLGQAAVGGNETAASDIVVMDDFLYGEPRPITPVVDFGDAPNTFGTLLANNGARHTAVGPFLGATRNTEADGQPSATANAATDDDGVTFPGTFTAGGTVRVLVTATAADGDTTTVLSTSFDWNGDGDFLDAGEFVLQSAITTGKASEVFVAVPADAKAGPVAARFRVSNVVGLVSSVGQLPDGEVEDYFVTVVPATVRSSAGATPASIQASVDAFRADLGTLNANVVGSFAKGRREINWDGVPDAKSAPANLPADFFNTTSPRGAVFGFAAGSAGTGFQVSADAANPTSTSVEFGNLNAQYPAIFQTFSAERLFTPLGDNAYEVSFFVPGSTTPATVGGFGAVFVDADTTASSIEYFDATGKSLGRFGAQPADNGLSFVGVNFTHGERVAKVVLRAGNALAGVTDAAGVADAVAFDDFIYGEPQAIVNTPPTITDVANQTVVVNTPVGPLAVAVADAETAAGSLVVTATSSNPTLIPTASVVVGGTAGNRTVTATPAAGQTGTATITVTVTDSGGLTATDTFTVTVNPPPPKPVLVGVPEFAAGADAGGGTAILYNADESVRFAVTPFGADFTGGVRTAAADFNGDGVADLVVGTGPGRATRVRILDGKSQVELFSVDPFEASFTGGVFVAAGDVTGDGVPDLAITPDQGGGPRVRVYSGAGFAQVADFFGIDDPAFRGGARAAAADVTGDGTADLIVAAGFGGGPRVAAFDGKSLAGTPVKLFPDFFAFEQTLRNGIFVAAGDLNGDGSADLVAGGGPGGGPRVLAFDGKSLLTNQTVTVANFFAGDANSRGGVRVAVKNLDSDLRADLVVGAGTAAGSRVTGSLGKSIAADGTPPAQFDFDAIPGFTGGVFVG